MRPWLGWVVGVLLLPALSGCSARVTPPDPQTLEQPQQVWVSTHALHAALIMPTAERQQWVLYEYGEWGWYAERNTAWYRFIPVFAWPTRGSLGRREMTLSKNPDADEVRRVVDADQVWGFPVERSAVDALRTTLDDRFAAHAHTVVYNAELRTWLVHDPDPYHLLRTCNHVLAQWLRRIGCSVRGWGPYWRWQVDHAADSATRPQPANATRPQSDKNTQSAATE